MVTRQPLAERMRPVTLDDVIGQPAATSPGSPLRTLADPSQTRARSVILYGPPGTGKTSLAAAVAGSTGAEFVTVSATSSNVKELRRIIERARLIRDNGQATILFVDEIHRFTKAQQDILLPAVEAGDISLIGATTENPSFAVNSALNSRSSIVQVNPLAEDDLITILTRAHQAPDGLAGLPSLADGVITRIARVSGGDARQALGLLESVIDSAEARQLTTVTDDDLTELAPTIQRYDRDGDMHYDIISAFIKSMRGSDPGASLYWLSRLIESGEDPRFIARRLIIHASEDVGLADSSVLSVCVAAAQAVQLVGLPEARINLAHATLAVATAPKSNSVIHGINSADMAVHQLPDLPVPTHLRDAHYAGAAELGNGLGYFYPHDFPGHVTDHPVNYYPERLRGSHLYRPSGTGNEVTIQSNQEAIHAWQNRNHSS